MKKLLPLLLCLLLLCGCAAPADTEGEAEVTTSPETVEKEPEVKDDPKPAYPALPDITEARLAELKVTTADMSVCTFSYPGEDWVIPEENGLITALHYTDGLYDGAKINLALGGKVTIFQSHSIDEETAKTIAAQIEAENAGHTIEVQELRSFRGETVFYAELLTAYSDAWLDSLLESGQLTEEELELAGGREAVTAQDPIHQLYLAAVADDTVVFLTGVYVDEAQKNTVLETMLVILSTLNVK